MLDSFCLPIFEDVAHVLEDAVEHGSPHTRLVAPLRCDQQSQSPIDVQSSNLNNVLFTSVLGVSGKRGATGNVISHTPSFSNHIPTVK